MNCTNCDTENHSGVKFCHECGTRLDIIKKRCTHCNAKNISDSAVFCPDCGKLTDSKKINTTKTYQLKYNRPEMVFVEGDTFEMGSTEGNSDEKPIHSVIISSYYICKYPITQTQWEYVMNNNPSYFGNDKNCPVVNVSWYDCVQFCNALSEANGYESVYDINGDRIRWIKNRKGFRLPTEAEWEFAARGGIQSKGYKYAGNNDIDKVACYIKNGGELQVVGCLEPNELGIYDMSGNVWEWCWDWFDVYTTKKKINPTGPTSGSYRAYRGGSWFNAAEFCRSTYRFNYNPNRRNNFLGLRLVLSL